VFDQYIEIAIVVQNLVIVHQATNRLTPALRAALARSSSSVASGSPARSASSRYDAS
jgi:hypothetical protein